MKFVKIKIKLHDNPCTGTWNLCSSPVDYIHSSAKYYLAGQDRFYIVTDVADIEQANILSGDAA